MCQRRHDEALIQANLGLELDPLDPLALTLYAIVMEDVGDYPSAVEHFEKALAITPGYILAAGNILKSYRHGGYYDKWIKRWKQMTCWEEEDKMTVENTLHEQDYVAAVKALLKINEKYTMDGKDCHMRLGIKKMWYIEAGEYDKAFACLEELYALGQLDIPYMATNGKAYEHFKSYPGYVEILKKFKLPLPKQ